MNAKSDRANMDKLGRLIARATSKKILEQGLTKTSIVAYLSQGIYLGDKTIQRRLGDGQWDWRTILALVQLLRDEELTGYVKREIDEAQQ